MNQFNLWYKILFMVCSLMIIMGIFIALFNQSSIFNTVFNNNINPTFWGNENLTTNTLQFQKWIYGILGATISGWGIFMLFIVYFPFREKQKWAWSCITIGISIWFIIDTSISLYFRVIFNALFNTILFLAILIPMYFTHKYFRRH